MSTRFLVGLVFTASLLAQGPPSSGSISGRVIDMDTNAPLAGVNVGSQAIGRVATDAEGRYVLRNVPPGTFNVFVQEANGGYLAMTLNLPKRVTVTAGRETTGVDFRVRLDAQISGRVLDETGEPLPGIRVSVVEEVYFDLGNNNYSTGQVAPRIHRSAITDDRGAYSITSSVFARRHYYVLAQGPTRYANPVSDLPADPQSRRRSLVPTYYPNASSLSSAVAIIPKSLEHRRDVDIRMRRAPNYCLEATLNAGATPARMRFAIQDEEVPAERLQATGVPPLGGETGVDGRIRVCDLYSGNFKVSVAQPPVTNGAPTPFVGALPVTISNGDVSGLNVITVPQVTISGEIVWDMPPPDPSFKPVINIRHAPFLVPGSGPTTMAIPVPGTFSFPALPTVEYSFSLFAQAQRGLSSGLPASMYVKDITYGGSSVMYDSLRPGAAAGNLRIIVGSDAGSIDVTAAHADGKPAAGTVVMILPASARTETELAATLRAGPANDNGLYHIANLPPGRYYVLATDDPPPSYTSLPGGTLSIAKALENLRFLLRVRSSGQLVEVGPRAAVQVRVTPKALE